MRFSRSPMGNINLIFCKSFWLKYDKTFGTVEYFDSYLISHEEIFKDVLTEG
jgi:hypothetical protein